jgi:hypothetical protein
MYLGSLPANEGVWRKASGQLAMPGDKGAKKSPPLTIGKLNLAPYPALPNAPDGFPYENPRPTATLNLAWYVGGAIANRGMPQYHNDWREYLRSAMVDSDWERVLKFMSWWLNRLDAYIDAEQFIRSFNYGSYKWVDNGRGGQRSLPFSTADFSTFFATFRKYASGKSADNFCINNAKKMALTNYDNKLRSLALTGAPMSLIIGNCPVHQGWEHAVKMIAAMTALAISAVYAIPGAAAAGAGAGAGAGASGAFGGAFAGTVTSSAASTGFKQLALTQLRKYALQKGVDYALNFAMKEYATEQNKKMTAKMKTDLRREFTAAQAEYDALIKRGVAPDAALETASNKGNGGAIIPLGLIAMALKFAIR